jgi:hypothetical protein
MEHYVTLFDSNFLPQGLALLESLERHAGDHRLWVLCLDDRTREVLDSSANPNLRTIPLAEVETPELLAVRPGRSRAEYCWTLTPFTPRFVFERDPSARRVTYLDADLFLLKSPRPIFYEFEASGKSVLITEHAFDAEYDQSKTYGRFCVQFMTFVRGESDVVRRWWEDRCLDWCFARSEDGKFGDQKYLDDWPERFPTNVHVLSQEDAVLAPWNARRFPYCKAIAWHFHGLRIQDSRIRWYVGYEIPRIIEIMVYRPYVDVLKKYSRYLNFQIHQGGEHSITERFRYRKNHLIGRLGKILRSLKHQKLTRF